MPGKTKPNSKNPRMKLTTSAALLIASLAMASVSQAALFITNGNFEGLPAADNSTDITGWYDYDAGNFWEQSWLEAVDVPDGAGLALAGGGFVGSSWAYQEIGTSDGFPTMTISFDYGSFQDAGSPRDLGVRWSAYIITGGFVPGQNIDINGASGVTLLDTAEISALGVGVGANAGPASLQLDISGAGNQTIYLRVSNFTPTTNANDNGYLWVDNISVAAIPEPSGVLLLGMAGLAVMKRRR